MRVQIAEFGNANKTDPSVCNILARARENDLAAVLPLGRAKKFSQIDARLILLRASNLNAAVRRERQQPSEL